MAIREKLITDEQGVKTVFSKDIKKYASSAHIIIPKRYAGKRAVISILIKKARKPEVEPSVTETVC